MKKIVNPLLNWYIQNQRFLPWRKDKNPYHIWVSEIMLQQTRIEAVIDYYYRFMKELPTIESLANCSQDKLLKLWEGLGYYNRARNLQKAAQMILEKYNGQFPKSYEKILALPGIGEYTASAIGSICFSLKEATVDGNVLRVYMRVNNCHDDITNLKVKKQVREKLISIMPEDSGSFNQGLMELGETICIPNGIPKCDICPIQNYCKAFSKKTYLELPVKSIKKEKAEEFYTILLFLYQNKVAICRRNESGLLHNLWQFFSLPSSMTLLQVKEYLNTNHIEYQQLKKSIHYVHIFTHKKWNMNSYIIFLKNPNQIQSVTWVTLEELEEIYALPGAFQPFKKVIIEEMINDDEA